MFNDKVLKSVADAVNQVMAEALKGDQHKIDKNKNNKIDAQDFKILRKEETVTEEEKKKSPFDWKNTPRETRDKGELTGHESKKTPTGTVYTKKAVKEEASQEEFNKEIKKAQAKSEGKDKADVAKPAVQAVQQEETQINELSSGLLDRAAKAASEKSKEARKKGHDEAGDEHMGQAVRLRAGYHDAVERDRKKTSLASMSPAKQRKYAISQKRAMGEEVEQVDERSLTAGEKAEMEKNVKGMKKNLQGFKERYGSRAKEVMYATATKQAKGE